MLHLFGFNLQETHNRYFLSSSFTDFWRRINIYWKDFMMKLVYYPIFMRIRKWGNTTALIVTTLVVFLATWVLHAYQWYWIRGTFLLTWNDGLFWAILGVLVVINALYESKHGRQRRLWGKALPWPQAVLTSLKTIGVFVTISVLWSFWSAHSVSEWLGAFKVLGRAPLFEPGAVLAIFLILGAVGFCALALARGLADRSFNFATSSSVVVISSLILLVGSVPAIFKPLGPQARKIMASLVDSELNQRDFNQLERGYYENLMDVGSFNSELWEVYRTRPADWKRLSETEAVDSVDSIPYYVLHPSIETPHHGATVKTNRWGMRDDDYELKPPPGVIRIAALGTSFVFGSGVENEEMFEAVLERRLNQSREDQGNSGFEILNFAVGGYSPLEHMAVLEKTAIEFDPDMVFYFEHADTSRALVNHLARAVQLDVIREYDFLVEVAARAGIDEAFQASADHYQLVQRLQPFGPEVLTWIYDRTAKLAEAQGIKVFWIYLPRPEKNELDGPPELEMELARQAGFELIDLSGVYGDVELSSLWQARWDHHPDAHGNQLIGDFLFDKLSQPDGPFELQLDRMAQRRRAVASEETDTTTE